MSEQASNDRQSDHDIGDPQTFNAVRQDLEPALRRAAETLRSALDEACNTNIERIDTGELIRVEEVLAIANEAAKEAISVRRRLRGTRRPKRSTGSTQRKGPPSAEASASASDAPESRGVIDSTGRRWTVFAVYPSTTRGRSVLRHGYADGWLSFDAGDETRRVAPIPEGWEKLSDEALLELCVRAESSRPRRRSSNAGMTKEPERPRD